MEENSTTMNLGNLQAGGIPAQSIPTTNEAVAPVSDLSINTNPVQVTENIMAQQIVSVVPEQSNLVQAQPEQPVAPVFTQTTSQEAVQTVAAPVPPTPPVDNTEAKKPVQRTDWDRMLVERDILNELLDNVSKMVTYEPRIELSTIVQLIFSANGLEVKASNGNETYIYQKNTKWTYSALGENSICLDSQFLYKLVTKITYPEILFKRSETDPKIIVIEAGTAVYNLPEKLDPNSGESINIEMPISFEGVAPIVISDYPKFRNALCKCIPFTGQSDGNALFNGVYIGKNHIIGSNGDSVCIVDSLPELATSEIYITRDFAKKLTTTNISGKVELSWKITEGRTHPSVVLVHAKDDNNFNEIIITGLLQEDEYYDDFPAEGVLNFKQMQFGQTMTATRSLFKEAIDRTILFFEDHDTNRLTLTITPGKMNIRSLSGGSDENVKIDGCVQALNTITMDATQLSLMLDSLSKSETTIKADVDHPGLLCVIDDGSIMILSEANGN